MNTFERIYEVVKAIPRGKVASYGQVAAYAGNPRWARVVGYALHVNPGPTISPAFGSSPARGSFLKPLRSAERTASASFWRMKGLSFCPTAGWI